MFYPPVKSDDVPNTKPPFFSWDNVENILFAFSAGLLSLFLTGFLLFMYGHWSGHLARGVYIGDFLTSVWVLFFVALALGSVVKSTFSGKPHSRHPKLWFLVYLTTFAISMAFWWVLVSLSEAYADPASIDALTQEGGRSLVVAYLSGMILFAILSGLSCAKIVGGKEELQLMMFYVPSFMLVSYYLDNIYYLIALVAYVVFSVKKEDPSWHGSIGFCLKYLALLCFSIGLYMALSSWLISNTACESVAFNDYAVCQPVSAGAPTQ